MRIPAPLRLTPLVLLLASVACRQDAANLDTAAAEDVSTASAAVDQMKVTLQEAFVARDTGRIADLFSDDAVLILPDGQLVAGRDSIASRIAALLPTAQGYSITTQGFRDSSDLSYEQEVFSITLAGVEGAEPRTVAGHHLVVLGQEADGDWKIVRSGIWLGQQDGMEGMGH